MAKSFQRRQLLDTGNNDLTKINLLECCSIFSDEELLRKVGVTNAEGPPVPIPNTEVKLCSGENTWLEAAREDSSMPTQDRERKNRSPILKPSDSDHLLTT